MHHTHTAHTLHTHTLHTHYMHTQVGPDSAMSMSGPEPEAASRAKGSSKWQKPPTRSKQRGIIPRTVEQVCVRVCVCA